MSKTLMIDPPSGWKYGFPRPAPAPGTLLRSWLIENGYPEKDVDFALRYCRYYETDANQEVEPY